MAGNPRGIPSAVKLGLQARRGRATQLERRGAKVEVERLLRRGEKLNLEYVYEYLVCNGKNVPLRGELSLPWILGGWEYVMDNA